MSTVAKLRELFDAVTTTLTEAVKTKVVEIEVADGKTVSETILPQAAHVANALALLKMNNITADPETNAGLRDLNKALAARRRGSPQVNPKDLESMMDQHDKDFMQ